MITIKTAWEIEQMRRAGKAASAARKAAGQALKPGVTTAEIDEVVVRTLKEYGALASFYKYHGYPASVCVSVNDEVIHGIPGSRKINEGDIVKIDVGAIISGYHGDTAETFAVGRISDEAQRLIDVTRQSFYEGIKMAKAGNRISDISSAIGSYVEKNGFSTVRMYTGHGVGSKLHEDPEVPNYGHPGRGPRLIPGMTIAVEPMVNAGGYEVRVMPDGWTVKTADKSLSAHYEHTVLITDGEPELLTL
jgi:methionyl aminopeptidase